MGILVLVGLSSCAASLFSFFSFGIFALFLIPVYGLWKMVSGQPTPRNLHADPRVIVGSMTRPPVVGSLSEAVGFLSGNVVCLRGVRDPHGVFLSFSLSVSWPRLALMKKALCYITKMKSCLTFWCAQNYTTLVLATSTCSDPQTRVVPQCSPLIFEPHRTSTRYVHIIAFGIAVKQYETMLCYFLLASGISSYRA